VEAMFPGFLDDADVSTRRISDQPSSRAWCWW
jgi:hypothetical protein